MKILVESTATVICPACKSIIHYDSRILDENEMEGAFCSEECAYPERFIDLEE